MDPEQTADVMRERQGGLDRVQSAGCRCGPPKIGFRYALRNGADFMVVGMFDFQVRDNTDLVKETLASMQQRERPGGPEVPECRSRRVCRRSPVPT